MSHVKKDIFSDAMKVTLRGHLTTLSETEILSCIEQTDRQIDKQMCCWVISQSKLTQNKWVLNTL